MKKTILFTVLLLTIASVYAGKVDTLSFYSNALKKETKFVVVTPDNYALKKAKLPVVYLLHGHSGNYSDWSKISPLAARADELNVIIVCPDGGFNSWYFDSPVDSTVRYETMVSSELINYIDQHYLTIADRKHRAITGLSMGGHGALYLAFHHKDLFGAVGSTSGGVDIRPFPKNWQLNKVLGDIETSSANWEKNTVINMADGIKNGEQKIIFDCGTGDFFLDVNRRFHQKLLDLKIDHDYIERPGAHNRAYWGNSIDYQLLFFKKFFEGA